MKDLIGQNDWTEEIHLDISCAKCARVSTISAKKCTDEAAKLLALFRDDHPFFCDLCTVAAKPSEKSPGKFLGLLDELIDWAVERQKDRVLSFLRIKSRALRAQALDKSFLGADRMEFDRKADSIDFVISILTDL